MKDSSLPAWLLALLLLALPACNSHKQEHHEEAHKVTASSPEARAVTLTEQYVCQIHSQRHIEVRALQTGYLEAISVKEGQTVKKGDLLFKVIPVLYQSRLDAELAEAKLAQIEFDNTKKLFEYPKPVVSIQEVALAQAKLDKANAKVKLAAAELNFASVIAPFDGIVDRLHLQQGSLVQEGEILSTLSDNSVMWVYFNVPEARYLEYMATPEEEREGLKIQLVLANGETFNHVGKIGAIEADFNNETGNIPFRADFPNAERLLRHGQTGTVLLSRVEPDAIVIPQRSTFEILDKRYVFVIDQDNVVHQHEITVKNELEDIFVVGKGIGVDDKIVLEGVRQVRDGDKVEFEFLAPADAFAQLKYRAE